MELHSAAVSRRPHCDRRLVAHGRRPYGDADVEDDGECSQRNGSRTPQSESLAEPERRATTIDTGPDAGSGHEALRPALG